MDAANKAAHGEWRARPVSVRGVEGEGGRGPDVGALAEEVSFLELLSKVQMEKGDTASGLRSLTQAKDLQVSFPLSF